MSPRRRLFDYFRRTALLFFAALSALLHSGAGKAATPEALRAYHGVGNSLIVEIPGRGWYWGSRKTLYELDRGEESKTEQGGGFFQIPNGHLQIEGRSATALCINGSQNFERLSDAQEKELRDEIRRRPSTLRPLPEIWEPLALLRLKNSPETYLYVTQSHFRSGGPVRAFLGPLGRWKEITVSPPGTLDRVGEYHFKMGGGFYLPLEIDLFTQNSGQRGQPTLIRGNGGKLETMEPVKLSGPTLRQAGISWKQVAPAPSPCSGKPFATRF